MGFDTHITEFAGLPVLDFPTDPEGPLPPGAEADGPQAWRIDCRPGAAWVDDYRADFETLFRAFAARVDLTRVEALVTGLWAERRHPATDNVVEVVCAHAERLPALRAVFVGELTRLQSDIAYYRLKPVTPLLEAFPRLEQLWVRSGAAFLHQGPYDDAPIVGPVGHDTLCTLVVQSGGTGRETVLAIGRCDFPALEHLELYLGEPEYGGNATVADLDWILAGDRLPSLRHLGLRDSLVQDDVAVAVAHAPVVAQLRTLDLSLGALGDAGAAALLAGQPLGHLEKLDLHHHFLSDEMQRRLREAWPTVEIDLSEPQTEEAWGRYAAVAE